VCGEERRGGLVGVALLRPFIDTGSLKVFTSRRAIIVTSEFALALAATHRGIAIPAMRYIETCKDSRYKVQEITVETRVHCPRAFRVAYGAAHYNYLCINAVIPPRHDVETPSGW